MSAKGTNDAVIEDAIKRGLRLEDGEIVLPSGKRHEGKMEFKMDEISEAP